MEKHKSVIEVEKLSAEYAEMLKKFQDEMRKKAEVAMKHFFKEYFDANPKVNAVYWTQYTPYFNDGDTCEFSVHEINMAYGFEADKFDSDEIGGGYVSIYPEGTKDLGWENETKILKPVTNLIRAIGEDTMEKMFGDHALVIVTRDGVEVREYDHD